MMDPVLEPADPGPAGQVRIVVRPGPLAGPAISRIVSIGAARAELPVDRLNDALIIADLLTLHASPQLAMPDSRLAITIEIHPGRLAIQAGPLREGSGAGVLSGAGVAGADGGIRGLASSAAVVSERGSDMIVIDVGSNREAAPGRAAGVMASVPYTPADFSVTRIADPSGVQVVAVRGDIDIATAPAVKQCAREAIFAGNECLVLDLSDTAFLDSTGLGMIIGVLRLLRPDGDLAIVNADAGIAKTFEITGLGEILTICATLPEAIAALARTP